MVHETINSKFVNNILQDFRDVYTLPNKHPKIYSIMTDLILLRAALEEKEQNDKYKK